MNRNKRAFNIFNTEMPFLLPQPIPEPPRVINPRPMVPDLSITSDVPPNDWPLHQNKDNCFDKYKTLYPMPPKPLSPPKHPIVGQQLRQFATELPTNIRTNNRFSERRVLTTHSNGFNEDVNCLKNRNGFGLTEDNNNINRKNVFTNGRLKDERPFQECRNSGKPMITRHSANTCDPIVNQMKTNPKNTKVKKAIESLKPITSNTRNGINGTNIPTNEVMFDLIKQQDIQLQRIGEQIEELLRIHKIEDKKVENIVNKSSVQTMTSIVFENNENRTPLTHRSKNRISKTANTTRTPSTASRDLRALRFQTISERSSEPSDIELDSNRLNFSESPRHLVRTSSIERNRENGYNNSNDDHFYDQMVNNIEVMLNNTSSDCTEEDSGRRSSCSPTPPHSRRSRQHRHNQPNRRHQIELQSEQTLYIKRLAEKYLVEDMEPIQTKPKQRLRKSEQNLCRTERTDLNVYGLTKNASIATKNYLEKYGLTYSPPKVQQISSHLYADINHKTRHKGTRSRILDIESLKRQPKLT